MKKKGFTLIELLAVIVILAIIALIATPIVMNVIENSKIGAAERTVENIEKAAELYYYENRLDGLFSGITFTCNGENCSSGDKVLQIKGKVPEVGTIEIDKEGVITLNSTVINGYSCYKENESYKCSKEKKEMTSSNDGVLTINSKKTELSNFRIYGNSVENEKFIQKLPSEYQQVEYLESTGTQYIDTGYTPSVNLDDYQEFFTKFMVTGGSGDRCVGGVRNGSTLKLPNVVSMIESQFYFQNNGDFSYNDNVEYSYFIKGKNGEQVSSLNGVEHSYSKSGVQNYNNSSIYLFALNKEEVASWFFVGKIYEVIFKNNGIEKRHFVPCYRKSDNVAGMYDLVEGKFYSNMGTGSFLIGKKIYKDNSLGNYNQSEEKYEIPIKLIKKNIVDYNYILEENNKTVSRETYNGRDCIKWTQANTTSKQKFLQGMFKKDTVYKLSFDGTSSTYNEFGYIYVFYTDGTYDKFFERDKEVVQGEFRRFEVTIGKQGKTIDYIKGSHNNGQTVYIDINTLQIEVGNTTTDFEMYEEQNYSIYLDEPLRCVDKTCDYIDFKSSEVVRNIGLENDGTLVKLKRSISEDVNLPNIKINEETNNIYIKTDILPSKVEIEYYK